jgi:S-adenosylmethionine hydrolase
MKGVILSIAPDAAIVDLVHTVPPQNIAAGAYLLGAVYRYFAKHTVHVVVVDPGVGTERAPIAVKSPLGTFVCPDNGLLSYVLADAGVRLEADPFSHGRVPLPENWTAIHLTNERYWLENVSTTFHGRDVFAPSAGFLAAGVDPFAMGKAVPGIEAFAVPVPLRRGREVIGQVLHIDHFGNLLTNIRETDLPPTPLTVTIEEHEIDGLSPHYQSGAGLIALMGSSGTLEIAVTNGNAARFLGAAVGADVRVTGSS